MAGYSVAGRNAALAGVIAVGDYLFLCTGDPGTTGANEAVDVPALPAGWETPAGGEVDSDEVAFVIPPGGGSRTYTHFGVRDQAAAAGSTFITGGPLDEAETFSDNGGTYNFTATLAAQTAT